MATGLEDFYNKIAAEQKKQEQFMHPWGNLTPDEQYGFARKMVSEGAGFDKLSPAEQAVKVYDFAEDERVDVARVNLSSAELEAVTSAPPRKVATPKPPALPPTKGISAADPVTQKKAAVDAVGKKK